MESILTPFVLLFSINVSSVLSFSNLLSSHGPVITCSVSSLMSGIKSKQTMSGICEPNLSCRHKGGEAIGRCGITEVCCIYPRTCGDTTIYNSTYFTNPGYPMPYRNSHTCQLTIHKIPGVKRICQLRLDFLDFELKQPNKGQCDLDFFAVNGQNLNSVVPKICGINSRQHLYVEIDGSEGPINLSIQTYGLGERRWNIMVSQIECNNPSKAPPNCLQYFTSPYGQIESFNYDIPLQTNSNEIKGISNWKVKGEGYLNEGYLNDLDYSICFRKEQYFCTQIYSVNSSSNSVNGVNDQSFNISSNWASPGIAGSGISECPHDYLLLNGVRFCGEKLNSKAINENNIIYNEDITDGGTGPFIARFVSDNEWSEESNRGFKLSFRQQLCSPNSHSVHFRQKEFRKKKSDSISGVEKHELNREMCKIFTPGVSPYEL